MTKEYLVTGCYSDKQTGKMVSTIVPLSSGISKGTGQPYEIADVGSRETVEGQYRVGTRLTASMTFTTQDHQENLKLGSSK